MSYWLQYNDTMNNEIATLRNNENSYSIFKVGNVSIKFYTSPYLRRYCSINHWDDRGYLEYTGEFSTSSVPIEDSIDLAFVARRLRLPENFFEGIKEVKII